MLFIKKCLLKFYKFTFNFMLWQIKKEITASKINYAKTDRVMRKLYFLITLSVQIADEKKSYLVIDLLKLAFGEKYIRPEEPLHLFSLCNELIKARKPVILSYLLDAYKPLVRNIETNQIIEIINNLNTLSSLLNKDKQKNYFVSKIITLLIGNIDYFCKIEPLQIAVAKLVQNIGIIAIKENDFALFCEISVCLTKIRSYLFKANLSFELSEILNIWFYYITKKNNVEFIISYKTMLLENIKEDDFSAECALRIITKIKDSMLFIERDLDNKFTVMSFLIYEFLAKRALTFNAAQTVNETIRLTKFIIEKYGLEQAFEIVILFKLLQLLFSKSTINEKISLKVVLLLEFIKVSQNLTTKENVIEQIHLLLNCEEFTDYNNIITLLREKWLELK
ncbi:MAG: hypothetical protein KBA19_03580 [Negativicutes bacterium]|nr:hypothetical protein [Negativicutes bacterium]